MLARGLLGNRGAFGDRRGPRTDRETTTGRAGCPHPSRNQRECYMSRAECKRYAGALCNGPALMSRLACEQAGPGAGPEASPSGAPAQDGAWSTARSPAGGLTTSSAVQPDSQGAPSSLAGTAGSLPQSWESGAGWAGTAARQRQVPETTSSHANSTAVTGLLRTCSSLGQFARLSSAAAESDGGTIRFPSFLGFGESPREPCERMARLLGGSHLQTATRRAATRGSPSRNGRACRQGCRRLGRREPKMLDQQQGCRQDCDTVCGHGVCSCEHLSC